ILSEDEDQPALDAAIAGDEAIAKDLALLHTEISALVRDHLVEFLEGTLVEEEFNALARGHLAFFMLTGAAFFTASDFGQRIAAFDLGECVFQINERNYSCRKKFKRYEQKVMTKSRSLPGCSRG